MKRSQFLAILASVFTIPLFGKKDPHIGKAMSAAQTESELFNPPYKNMGYLIPDGNDKAIFLRYKDGKQNVMEWKRKMGFVDVEIGSPEEDLLNNSKFNQNNK